MLLLRGGSSGTERDFYSDTVVDSPLLSSLPTISSLLDEDGPFGGAQYAFLFRTQPRAVSLVHRDLIDKWQDMDRIHVPLINNPGAHLTSDCLSIHFAAGHA